MWYIFYFYFYFIFFMIQMLFSVYHSVLPSLTLKGFGGRVVVVVGYCASEGSTKRLKHKITYSRDFFWNFKWFSDALSHQSDPTRHPVSLSFCSMRKWRLNWYSQQRVERSCGVNWFGWPLHPINRFNWHEAEWRNLNSHMFLPFHAAVMQTITDLGELHSHSIIVR